MQNVKSAPLTDVPGSSVINDLLQKAEQRLILMQTTVQYATTLRKEHCKGTSDYAHLHACQAFIGIDDTQERQSSLHHNTLCSPVSRAFMQQPDENQNAVAHAPDVLQKHHMRCLPSSELASHANWLGLYELSAQHH